MSLMESQAAPGDRTAPRYAAIGFRRAWAMALILAGLAAIAYLDRLVLALLVPDLSRAFAINDVQIGFLTGPAFIIPYNLFLLPAALAVDHWNRKGLIVTGAVIWTLMTMASAFAQSFDQLLALRLGVALGEAMLGPAAISLLGDLFERDDRPLPTATYITGSVVGSTGAPMMSAAILQFAIFLAGTPSFAAMGDPWRLTLIGAGLPGLMLGLLLLVVGREPARPARAAGPGAAAMREGLIPHLRRRGALYFGAFMGLGILNMIAMSLSLWAPTHLIRAFGLGQVEAGYWLGSTFLVTGVSGTLILPALFRHWLRARRIERFMPFTVAAILVLTACAYAGGNATSLAGTLAGFGAALFLLMGVGTLPTLFVQLYTPSHLRGRVSALLFFFVYLLASGVAPVAVPWIAENIYRSPAAIGQAIALVALAAGGGSALCHAAIHRILRRAEQEYGPAG